MKTNLYMVRNILKTAVRVSLRNRLFTFINLFGLSIGIAAVLMILIWITYELSFDKHYADSGQIYRVMSYGSKYMQDGIDGSPAVLSRKSREVFPEIIQSTAFESAGNIFIEANGRGYYENSGLICDTSFFKIFTFPFRLGNPNMVSNEEYSIILTKSLANKYFGRLNVINETLLFNNTPMRISGVIEDIPEYSSLRFSYILLYPVNQAAWGRFMSACYIKVIKGTDTKQLASKMTGLAKTNNCPQVLDGGVHFELQPMSDIHLDGSHNSWRPFYLSGNKQNILTFSLIALLILVIACFNYINLTMARMEKRVKEVGIRKVVGSSRMQLIRQFIGESLLFAVISLFFGFILIELLRPILNHILGTGIVIRYFDLKLISGVLIILIFTGLFAGIYPALKQSLRNPILVIKGNGPAGGSKDMLRKILVFLQFFIASVLLVVSLFFSRQTRFLQNKDLGFNTHNVLYLPMKENLGARYNYIKAKLRQHQGIVSVSAIDRLEASGGASRCTGCFQWKSIKNPQESTFDALLSRVDFDYFETLGIPIVQGRSFSIDFSTDSTEGFILNESAIKSMKVEKPFEEFCQLGGYGGATHEGWIVGVAKDINVTSLKEPIAPQVYQIMRNPATAVPDGVILIKYRAADYKNVLSFLEETWKEVNTRTSFEYYHLDETYDNLYKKETRNGILITTFTFLTIFIACLGLFGMITFLIERKTREIAIRKVFGSSSFQIIWRISWNVGRWIIIAFITSIPISVVISTKIFESYANKVSLNWWIYPIAFASILFVVTLTSLFKTLRISRQSLVEPLKYE
jgi:putative ABC transport system permease protein